MFLHDISDWNDAYANGVNIARGDAWPNAWVEPAREFRERLATDGRAELGIAYGSGSKHHFDLFMPKGEAKGVVIFVHGGYWMQFDQSFWSHLANGPVEMGYAVALPTYTLCPHIRIGGIVAEIGRAVAAIGERLAGPMFLTGHWLRISSLMICADSPLPESVRNASVTSSRFPGLHDLRPLMARHERDARHRRGGSGLRNVRLCSGRCEDAWLTCWVGAAERSEFIRQNALLANIWTGLGARTLPPSRSLIVTISTSCDGLADPRHPLVKTLLR